MAEHLLSERLELRAALTGRSLPGLKSILLSTIIPAIMAGIILLRLQVFIFVYCIETRAILSVIQVVVTDNHGAGVTPLLTST